MNGQAIAVGKNILLVDDQPEVREVIKALLSVDEHTVIEASNGREALARFQPGVFDLVITDFQMPQMRGDALAAEVKHLAPTQPILMVTGSADQSGVSAAAVDAVLNKPFLLDDLRQAVRNLLASASELAPRAA